MTASGKVKKFNVHKGLGVGSLSLLLFLLGILFSVSFGNYGAIGDKVLRVIGLSPWFNGDIGLHYTLIYSIVFFIPAFIIGSTFKNHFGAKLGRNLSSAAIVFLSILFVFSIL